jgi:hypothetical protein
MGYVGFESFGALDNVVATLRQTAALLSLRQCPTFIGGWVASYPRWLQQITNLERP